MWETFLTQQLAGKVAGGSLGGASAPVTVSPASRSDLGAQTFTVGNVSVSSRDKFTPWLAAGALAIGLVAVILLVKR